MKEKRKNNRRLQTKAVIGKLMMNALLAMLEVTNLKGTTDNQGQQLQITDKIPWEQLRLMWTSWLQGPNIS